MNYNLEIQHLLLEHGLDFEEAIAFSESEEIWENDSIMNKKQLLKYYEENPEELEKKLNEMKGEQCFHRWNANAWRNS